VAPPRSCPLTFHSPPSPCIPLPPPGGEDLFRFPSPPTGGRGEVRGASNPSPFSLGGEDLPFPLSLFPWGRGSPLFPLPPHLLFLSPQWGERRGEGGLQPLSPPGRGQGEGASLTGPPYPRTFPGSKPRRPGPAGRSSVTHATPCPSPPSGGRGEVRGAPSPCPSLKGGGKGLGGEDLPFPLSPVGGEGLGEGGTLPAPLPQGRGKRRSSLKAGKERLGAEGGAPSSIPLPPHLLFLSPLRGERVWVRGARSHPPRAPPSREGEKDSGERRGGLNPSPSWGRGSPRFPSPPSGGRGSG